MSNTVVEINTITRPERLFYAHNLSFRFCGVGKKENTKEINRHLSRWTNPNNNNTIIIINKVQSIKKWKNKIPNAIRKNRSIKINLPKNLFHLYLYSMWIQSELTEMLIVFYMNIKYSPSFNSSESTKTVFFYFSKKCATKTIIVYILNKSLQFFVIILNTIVM